MNNQILQKCVDELNKTTPDLSYLKGMLETVIAMSSGVANIGSVSLASAVLDSKNIAVKTDGSIHVQEENKELTPAEQAAQEAIAMATGGLQPAKSGIIEKNVILN